MMDNGEGDTSLVANAVSPAQGDSGDEHDTSSFKGESSVEKDAVIVDPPVSIRREKDDPPGSELAHRLKMNPRMRKPTEKTLSSSLSPLFGKPMAMNDVTARDVKEEPIEEDDRHEEDHSNSDVRKLPPGRRSTRRSIKREVKMEEMDTEENPDQNVQITAIKRGRKRALSKVKQEERSDDGVSRRKRKVPDWEPVLPVGKKYMAVRFPIDGSYYVYSTDDIRKDCWLSDREVIVGAQIRVWWVNRKMKYDAEIVGFGKDEEAAWEVADTHQWYLDWMEDLFFSDGRPTSQKDLDGLPRLTVAESGKKDDSCPICMASFGENVDSALLVLPCNHHFHEKCILTWLKQTNSCPTCRKKIPDKLQEEWERQEVLYEGEDESIRIDVVTDDNQEDHDSVRVFEMNNQGEMEHIGPCNLTNTTFGFVMARSKEGNILMTGGREATMSTANLSTGILVDRMTRTERMVDIRGWDGQFTICPNFTIHSSYTLLGKYTTFLLDDLGEVWSLSANRLEWTKLNVTLSIESPFHLTLTNGRFLCAGRLSVQYGNRDDLKMIRCFPAWKWIVPSPLKELAQTALDKWVKADGDNTYVVHIRMARLRRGYDTTDAFVISIFEIEEEGDNVSV